MMQDWFRQAKLGIFIHWGIYAVKGISESWSFYHGQISYEDYMAQCEGFTASNYDPEAWADLFRAQAPDMPCSPPSTTMGWRCGIHGTAT